KGENVPEPGVPESFKVLIKELQSLALDVRVLTEEAEEVEIREEEADIGEMGRELRIDNHARDEDEEVPRRGNQQSSAVAAAEASAGDDEDEELADDEADEGSGLGEDD